MGTVKFSKYTLSLTLIITLLLLSGCSSPKPKTLPVAQSTMASIEHDADVVEYASLELRVAKDKLEQAEKAAKDDENKIAERLAQEALVNLKLAEAKAESEKTANIVKDMEKSIATLRDELDRAR
jgi:Domain of unknown function (DUF4398)